MPECGFNPDTSKEPTPYHFTFDWVDTTCPACLLAWERKNGRLASQETDQSEEK